MRTNEEIEGNITKQQELRIKLKDPYDKTYLEGYIDALTWALE